MFRYVLVSWILTAFSCGVVAQKPQTYAIVQTFPLSQVSNGIDGRIELLMDARLSPSVREQLWGKGDWSLVLPQDSNLFKDFSALPPLNAKLRIRDDTGKLVAERSLERPLANLEEWRPASEKGGYLLSIDFSAGFGSYNGLGTTLLQVCNRTFHDVEALNAVTHKREPIRLAKSLKSDWRIEPRSEGTDILSLSSHPGNNGNFVSDYVRYSFDGKQWLEHKKQKDGLWESDQPFPPRSAFP